jgi:hypothetical protein
MGIERHQIDDPAQVGDHVHRIDGFNFFWLAWIDGADRHNPNSTAVLGGLVEQSLPVREHGPRRHGTRRGNRPPRDAEIIVQPHCLGKGHPPHDGVVFADKVDHVGPRRGRRKRAAAAITRGFGLAPGRDFDAFA